ncbi:MAG: hypothetical protein A2V91_05585 [Candidatus Muproteobacteria bacterium RBG_16_64_10]|uniref:Uncharacterized protein n=1 Tax=Candidatus Muproteobacteria bacterium RBG_16_64_10 TaxID=1817757 RepID=A0A1F6T7M7_9PROT|nr:MAG: hypothetical protein A2V91_05585 [Candidatus Muproteobacteria bacterium RBG_16_64_10]
MTRQPEQGSAQAGIGNRVRGLFQQPGGCGREGGSLVRSRGRLFRGDDAYLDILERGPVRVLAAQVL